MSQLSNPGTRAIAAAALLGVALLAAPVLAAGDGRGIVLAQAAVPPPPPPSGTPPAGAPPAAAAKAPAATPTAYVETRIKELHRKLHITKAQEPQWESVAQVMRSNATSMEALVHERYESAPKMTAVDDLRSYSALADAHADGLKKFLPVFEQVYDSLSDALKKTADTLFRNRMHLPGAAKAKPKAE